MTNARWHGGEERTSGSVFSIQMGEKVWEIQLKFRFSSCTIEFGFGVGETCGWLWGDEVKVLGSYTVLKIPTGLCYRTLIRSVWAPGGGVFWDVATETLFVLLACSGPTDPPWLTRPHSGSHSWSSALSTPIFSIQSPRKAVYPSAFIARWPLLLPADSQVSCLLSP